MYSINLKWTRSGCGGQWPGAAGRRCPAAAGLQHARAIADRSSTLRFQTPRARLQRSDASPGRPARRLRPKLRGGAFGISSPIIEVSVAHIEQLTYSEFIHSLPNPTCFNLLKAEQLDGQLCLEISPLIIYPVIDRLLGGSNADLFIPQRPSHANRAKTRAAHHRSRHAASV